MKKQLQQTLDCLINDTFRRIFGRIDYCVLFYPSCLWDFLCPYLEKRSTPIQLGEGLFSVKLDYWLCHKEEYNQRSQQKVTKHLQKKLSELQ